MKRNSMQTTEKSVHDRCCTPRQSHTPRMVTDGGEPTEDRDPNPRDDPPEIVPLWPVPGYQTEVDRSEDTLNTYESSPGDTPLEELQEMCVCKGKWVESLAAVSSSVRHSDYEHPDDELWVLATLTQMDVYHERQVRIELFEGNLVRVEDLPDSVDIPEYERPFNYRSPERAGDTGDDETADGGEE